MFKNLKKSLQGKGITIKNYASFLGISEKSASNKLNGITEFTYSEFKKTCVLLIEYNADYLFATEDTKQTA